jgi:hypothetical protein
MNDEKKSGPNPWIAIIISIAAFVVSSTTLYFTHFYISESLYILLLGFDIRKMEETDHEGNPRSLVNGLIANHAVPIVEIRTALFLKSILPIGILPTTLFLFKFL